MFFTAPDGASLHYEDEGEGLPLLCLSGLTRNTEDFSYLAPHLPPCRLIRMDYRGRGRSAFTGPKTYNVPQEGADAIALLDHLGLPKAAILGTSRGGLIALYLAATAKPRLSGICLNDVGPVVEPAGLARIEGYLGHRPRARTLAEMAKVYAMSPGFSGVPESRWLEEARHHYIETPSGLDLRYDPALREPFIEAMKGAAPGAPPPDAWPLFDATAGLPLALLRGAHSEILSAATAAEMRRRRPDMIFAEIEGRAHIPFLDEPASLAAIRAWLGRLTP
ncbi:alpha/beta fold hydrolase [Solirhodobacter olei]|uniref:alpha/beta fold hydrolase n=1 Tax=Solirhodobacter olei TaxID=2493082 RepID=UPI000FD8ECE6|nr:alpha/beta hydrolase [Solirhodobacter olei]